MVQAARKQEYDFQLNKYIHNDKNKTEMNLQQHNEIPTNSLHKISLAFKYTLLTWLKQTYKKCSRSSGWEVKNHAGKTIFIQAFMTHLCISKGKAKQKILSFLVNVWLYFLRRGTYFRPGVGNLFPLKDRFNSHNPLPGCRQWGNNKLSPQGAGEGAPNRLWGDQVKNPCRELFWIYRKKEPTDLHTVIDLYM